MAIKKLEKIVDVANGIITGRDGAFGIYINETNKDSDWNKYLNALDEMDRCNTK